MQTIIVKRSNASLIKFVGELIATTSSTHESCHPDYSGIVGRSSKLALYKTKAGKYVCQRINYTLWQGESTTFEGVICESAEEIMDFFGHDWLAKEIYDYAEIDDAILVD